MAMTDAQLRARVRELMAAGVLPSEAAPIPRPVPPAPTGPKPHMFIGESLLDKPCTIRAREATIRERELPHYADAVATEAAETVRGFNLATGRVPSVRCGVETESARCSSR